MTKDVHEPTHGIRSRAPLVAPGFHVAVLLTLAGCGITYVDSGEALVWHDLFSSDACLIPKLVELPRERVEKTGGGSGVEETRRCQLALYQRDLELYRLCESKLNGWIDDERRYIERQEELLNVRPPACNWLEGGAGVAAATTAGSARGGRR